MVFTSPTFLFLFLPGILAGFFITPPRLRTALLVVASWLFYAWGEKHLVVLLALSTVINWALALMLDRAAAPPARRLLLTIAVVVNIGALLYFKYTNFLVLERQHPAAARWSRLDCACSCPLTDRHFIRHLRGALLHHRRVSKADTRRSQSRSRRVLSFVLPSFDRRPDPALRRHRRAAPETDRGTRGSGFGGCPVFI